MIVLPNSVTGIPALLNEALGISRAPSKITADAPTVKAKFATMEWGIYDATGKKAIDCDSMIQVGFRREYHIPDYPVADGGFQSYNKVRTPDSIRLSMSMGRTYGDRAEFLLKAEELVASLELFDVHLPEIYYTNMNPTSFDFERNESGGTGLVTINMTLMEVRSGEATSVIIPRDPSAAPMKSGGTVSLVDSAINYNPPLNYTQQIINQQ